MRCLRQQRFGQFIQSDHRERTQGLGNLDVHGMAVDVLRKPALDDPACAHDRQLIGNRHRGRGIVGDEQRRFSCFVERLERGLANFAFQSRVEA